jgi:hypothetical protein
MKRREFLRLSAYAAAAVEAGCVSNGAQTAAAPLPKLGDIRALLLHLGHNMWCDWFPPDVDPEKCKAPKPDCELRNKDDLWLKATDYAVQKGVNMIVIDVGEGVVYPSHPELSIRGSWSVGKLQAEVRRLRKLGVEAVPKLNFSTSHNGWLKQYRRMLSTPTYYKVCEDIIADVAEIFDTPRFFHIGFDEETAHHQDNSRWSFYISVRKGEFWWYDFLHIVRTVEKNSMRAWTWSDYGWDHPDYYTRCPKSVLMSNWYYDESYGGFELAENKTQCKKRLQGFYELDKAGFEQVPCGTNWSGWKRRQLKIGADDVIGKLVKVCRRDISKNLLKGFMMAPWASCDTQEHLDFNLKGIDLFAEALKA